MADENAAGSTDYGNFIASAMNRAIDIYSTRGQDKAQEYLERMRERYVEAVKPETPPPPVPPIRRGWDFPAINDWKPVLYLAGGFVAALLVSKMRSRRHGVSNITTVESGTGRAGGGRRRI